MDKEREEGIGEGTVRLKVRANELKQSCLMPLLSLLTWALLKESSADG